MTVEPVTITGVSLDQLPLSLEEIKDAVAVMALEIQAEHSGVSMADLQQDLQQQLPMADSNMF